MTAIVINGECTFLDQNGDPLSGGLVYFYVNNTSTLTTTYQDQAGTIPNTNPVVLDQAGRATIWAPEGPLRQVVQDQFGNVQWDKTAIAGIDTTTLFAHGLSVTGNLGVSGDVFVTGGGHFANGVFASQPSELVGLTVTADSFFQAPASFQSDVGVNGAFTTIGDSHLGGNLFVTLDTSSAGNVIVGAVGGTGHTVIINSASSPSFAAHNLVDDSVLGMWNASGLLQWGILATSGAPVTTKMELDQSGNLTTIGNATVGANLAVTGTSTFTGNVTGTLNITGNVTFSQTVVFVHDIVPSLTLTQNIGSAILAWDNVYAHNYVTVSTSADSALLGNGQLEVVRSVPVKTAPHIGLSAEDIAKAEGEILGALPEGGGTSYNALVGVLWKALQELSDKFDAYVEAHP